MRRMTWMWCVVGLLTLAGTVTLTGTVAGQEAFDALEERDAFNLYDVDPIAVDATVELEGQFDERPAKAVLTKLTHFATVVSIDEQPVVDLAARFTVYQIAQEEKFEPVRTVRVRNRYGEHNLSLGDAKLLLVPASQDGNAPAEGLDTYKCYTVLVGCGRSCCPPLLEDQYGKFVTHIGGPALFCVPVSVDGAPIQDPDTHFTIYGTARREVDIEASVTDAYGAYDVHLRRNRFLIVPTLKLSVFPPPRKRTAPAERPDMVGIPRQQEGIAAWLEPSFALLRRMLSDNR